MSNFTAIIEIKSFSKQKVRTKVIIEAENKKKARNKVYQNPEIIEFLKVGGLFRLKILEGEVNGIQDKNRIQIP